MIDVRELRESLNMTRAEFSAQIGASVDTIQSWELGRREPTEMAVKIMLLLKANPEAFDDLDREFNVIALRHGKTL